MKVEFGEQTFSHFKAFSGKHALQWDAPGVTYVAGRNKFNPGLASNGSGKSSTSDALCWCLYGRTPALLRNPDIQPWLKSGDPAVTVEVTVDGKIPHNLIRRSVNPNKLFLNGKEVAQDAIDDLIGMSFDLFTNTVLLAQDADLFYDLKPTAKMELFSTTLGWDRWDTRSKAASERTEAAEREIVEIRSRVEAGEGAIEEIDRTLVGIRSRAEEWATKARASARDAKSRAAALQKDHDAKDKQLATALLREDGAATELRAQTIEVRKLEHDLVRARINVTNYEEGRQIARDARATIREELAELKRAKVCPTCNQPVKPANLAEHRAEVERTLAELDAKIAAEVPVKLTTTVQTLERQLAQAQAYEEGFRGRAEGARSEIDRLRPEVASLKTQLAEARKAASAETENPFTQQISTLMARKKELSELLKAVELKIAEVSARAERNRYWIKGFKDIKLQLVEDILQELEIVTNGMLDAVGLTDWAVRYDIEKENKSGSIRRELNVQINSPQSKGFVKWESWSGGEQQRLRLIGALALSDVLLAHAGVETNLEILDEPAVYWSAEGVQELCAYLAERARETGKSIWYTEHQAVESSHFSNTLTVVRDEKGAYIED